MNKVFIGIGSNIGDRFENLRKGIKKISKHKTIELINVSSIYESDPMYYENQDKFLNIVIEVSTNENPFSLLKIFKKVEIDLGRDSSQKHNEPRIIDIDILDFFNFTVDDASLKLPHPKIKERLFVLKPWNDISPEYIITNSNKTINELMLLLDTNNKIIKLHNNIL